MSANKIKRQTKEYFEDYFRSVSNKNVEYWLEMNDYKKVKFKWYQYISIVMECLHKLIQVCYTLYLCKVAITVLMNEKILESFKYITLSEFINGYFVGLIVFSFIYSFLQFLWNGCNFSFFQYLDVLRDLSTSSILLSLIFVGSLTGVIDINFLLITAILVILLKKLSNHICLRTYEIEKMIQGNLSFGIILGEDI